MAETDLLAGRAEQHAVKSYFVRKAPFGGSHILLGGITAALRTISELQFDTEEFAAGMRSMGYRPGFIDFLKARRGLRNITVYAPSEGTPFFPNEPIVSIAGPLPEVRLADGILISECNFASLAMTKWNRIVRTVRPGGVLEFARRRSQNHMKSSLYGMLAGCTATSNSELRRSLEVPVRGTMGHEWMQSFQSLEEAFDTWLSYQPGFPVGLIDTVRCMEEDFPKWLDAAYRHRDSIKATDAPVWGWRNDSGDLAYLVIEQYVRFLRHPLAQDDWFKSRMRMFLTNELDEYSSSSIIAQIATQARAAGLEAEDILHRIIWAAGTKPGVCADDPALGGVMKLMESDGRACIKLALDADGRVGLKTSIPGFNLSGMIHNGIDQAGILLYSAGRYVVTAEGKLHNKLTNHDVEVLKVCHPDNATLTHEFENYRLEPRQQVVYKEGMPTQAWEDNRPTVKSVAKHIATSLDALPWWITRIEKPHSMPVWITPDLFSLRDRMIRLHALQAEYQTF
jgi:nicotinate phosphoribosyltransferase